MNKEDKEKNKADLDIKEIEEENNNPEEEKEKENKLKKSGGKNIPMKSPGGKNIVKFKLESSKNMVDASSSVKKNNWFNSVSTNSQGKINKKK